MNKSNNTLETTFIANIKCNSSTDEKDLDFLLETLEKNIY